MDEIERNAQLALARMCLRRCRFYRANNPSWKPSMVTEFFGEAQAWRKMVTA